MPKPRVAYEALTSADIGGRTTVVCKIRPKLPQEEMQRSQIAQALRAPGADGRPLASDRYIREEVLELDYPDTIDHQIDAQLLPAQSQPVQQAILAAREQYWFEHNQPVVELAEKRLGEPIKMYPEQFQALFQMMLKEEIAKLMGQGGGLSQMLMAAEQGGAPPGIGAPGGVPPEAMPSQMMMSPEDVLPDPATLPSKQAQRGRPQNR